MLWSRRSTMALPGWDNFFVAEAGAAAALSGLLFVAVSINLKSILEIATLPERAGESLLMLMAVLLISSFGLIPGQGRTAFGIEVLAVSSIVWIFTVRVQRLALRYEAARQWLPLRAAATQAALVPFLVAGALLVRGADSGIYWIVPGTIASFSAGVLNAWVLLIEIQR
jgi:hypothetical protein